MLCSLLMERPGQRQRRPGLTPLDIGRDSGLMHMVRRDHVRSKPELARYLWIRRSTPHGVALFGAIMHGPLVIVIAIHWPWPLRKSSASLSSHLPIGQRHLCPGGADWW